jgi:hypothetical protein
MNRCLFYLAIALLFTWGVKPVLAGASSADTLFQDAVMKESGERDLEGAIDLYRQAAEHAGTDHRLASQARLRMASCYERLGKSKEAEQTYIQIISDATAAIGEINQEAQIGLERLKAQEKKTEEEAARARPQPPIIYVREYMSSRASISAGPSYLISRAQPLTDLSVALRYRVSPDQRPLAWYVEASAIIPMGDSKVGNQIQTSDASTTDTASVTFNYQTSFALLGELPHGRQRLVIPEMGAGVAMTSAKIVGSTAEKYWGPYAQAGLHFFADHIISFLLQGAYTGTPYPESINIAAQGSSPAHTTTFNFPSSNWSLAAKAQIKVGWFSRALKPVS